MELTMVNSLIGKLVLVLGTSFIIGCASKPPVVDNSPVIRAAQITSKMSSTGIKGQFAHEAERSSFTHQDMRRVNNNMKFTGSIMSRIGGAQSRSDIIRIDRSVEWEMDNKMKRYQECPLGGCEGVGQFRGSVFDAESEGDFEENPECVITVSEQKFSITKTGQQRELNGFPAEEYLIDWRAIATDEQGGKAENLFEINVWTTPKTPAIVEALEMQDRFDDNYRAAVGDSYPESIDKAIPREAMAMLERFFIETLEDRDVAKLRNLMGNATKIEGFPISRKIKWDARNTTCSAPPEPEEASKSRLDTGSLKGLLGSVGKQIINQEVDKKKEEKAREIELAPIFLFIEDVTAIEMVDMRESQLTVPANYKLQTRR